MNHTVNKNAATAVSKKESGFRIWWNTPSAKAFIGSAYSIGAAIVILGAMFKILHLPGASVVLGVGMVTEALIFALSAFDKPHKEYEWDRLFDFGAAEKMNGNALQGGGAGYEMKKSAQLNDEEIVRLSDGIKSLSETAAQLNTLSDAIKPADEFVKNISSASKATDDYVKLQSLLNSSTQKMAASYDGIGNEVDAIVKNTKAHADKVESINKNLASMNSIYEIHLKNITVQSENLNSQSEQLRIVGVELDGIAGEVQSIRTSAKAIADETGKYKEGTAQLTKQIAALNQVYGNMLNSLS